MIRHPALLAASLSGRPLLMREASVPALAGMLGLAVHGERPNRTGFAGLLSRVKALALSGGTVAAAAEDLEHLEAPSAYAPRWMGEPDYVGFGWCLADGIASIEISGPLMAEGFGWYDCWYHGYDTLSLAFEEIEADARVQGVLVYYKTPGGVLSHGLPELAAQIRAMTKPVWAFCEAAYSAGYWLACQSDRVIAPREGGVGSIGAVMTHCGMAGMLEKDGIVVTAFKFGAKKTDGSPFEPLSETASADFQAEIQQCGEWFVADVLAGRPSLSEETVLATEAGCYFGDSANPDLSGLKLGLVDAVMTEREAYAALRAEVSPENPAPSGAPTASKEKTMKRSQVSAALTKAGASKSLASKVLAELPEDEKPAEGEESEEEEEPAAEGEEPEEEAEEEDDKPVDAKTAKAILALPEAKGREGLANKLAFTGGMTVSMAKSLLASAGKTNTLADRMAGKDPKVAVGGGRQTATAPKSARDQFAANREAGLKAAGRR